MADTSHIDVPQRTCECPHCKGGHALVPFPIVTHCPRCGMKHVDQGEWTTKLHRTHQCESWETADGTIHSGCGFKWQPSLVYTVGVEGLI